MFDTLQDRLSATFKNLRGKGRITEADIDDTAREIRRALLEADVNLAVVKDFITTVKDRARGAELSRGAEPRPSRSSRSSTTSWSASSVARPGCMRYAKRPPTVIMLAGLQGAGKTTLAGKLAVWLKDQGHSPLLVAADLQRPNAVNQLQVVGQRAGVHVFAPEPGNACSHDDRGQAAGPYGGDPVAVAKASDRRG